MVRPLLTGRRVGKRDQNNFSPHHFPNSVLWITSVMVWVRNVPLRLTFWIFWATEAILRRRWRLQELELDLTGRRESPGVDFWRLQSDLWTRRALSFLVSYKCKPPFILPLRVSYCTVLVPITDRLCLKYHLSKGNLCSYPLFLGDSSSTCHKKVQQPNLPSLALSTSLSILSLFVSRHC